MNVLHLPTPTGGNAWGLSRGERQLGLNSDVLYKESNWLNYPYDFMPPDSKSRVIKNLKRIPFFCSLMDRYDIFHYNFGKSFFDWPGKIDLLELPILASKSKKIFVTYNGCDARLKFKRIQQAEICCCSHADCYGGVCSSLRVDKIKEQRISRFHKYHAGFFAVNPDLMNYLPEGTIFLPYTVAGWDDISTKDFDHLKGKPIRIIHAPTNRVVKGTDVVINVVNNIQKRYPGKIELKLVEKVSHSDALREYEKADIVIDQLRVGWYGGLAVEVMKMGKPVVAYINHDDLHFIPKQMALDCEEAIINANEFTLEDVLLHYIDNMDDLLKKREAQLEYVHKWHDPQYVASITKEKYEEI